MENFGNASKTIMKKYAILVILLCGLLSCQPQNSETNGKAPEKLTISDKKEMAEGKTTKDMEISRLSSAKDVFQVPGDCAILMQLTDLESDSIEQASGQDNGEYADDLNSSTLEMTDLLEKLGIKTLTVNKRYISYVNPETSEPVFLDTRKTADYTFGSFIFFSKTKQPGIFESTILSEEIIKKYFNK